ncbi:hypothetical protein ACFCYM_18860 [Streptomyces sp. NPDC056254]|uniref:hypothetical protein n=1 Tax=Streptomyces sp. NPDC056254 TaxID=3345763 RepID=UPI0035E0C2E0
MISEPELDGVWESARPMEVAQDEAVRERRPDRPWWWVAAAVVVTSALWAGGLYAFGDRLGQAAPEARYTVPDDLCEPFKGSALTKALGPFTESTPRKAGRAPALDWAACTRDGDTKDGPGGYIVVAMVELHKVSDPAPEFGLGAPSDRMFGNDLQWEEVPGLGEQALVGSSGRGGDLRLRVRDGGAVFTFDTMFFTRSEEAGPPEKGEAQPDQDALTAAAIEDMRALMAALRKD